MWEVAKIETEKHEGLNVSQAIQRTVELFMLWVHDVPIDGKDKAEFHHVFNSKQTCIFSRFISGLKILLYCALANQGMCGVSSRPIIYPHDCLRVFPRLPQVTCFPALNAGCTF